MLKTRLFFPLIIGILVVCSVLFFLKTYSEDNNPSFRSVPVTSIDRANKEPDKRVSEKEQESKKPTKESLDDMLDKIDEIISKPIG